MRVLVTGASGFIGRNVLLRAPRDWEVVAVHRRPGLADFVQAHRLDHVQAIRCDLASAADVGVCRQRAGLSGHFDACLYLAANGDPARSAERPGWDLESNAFALINLLDAVPIGRFVFVSSGAVYDGLVGDVTPASRVEPKLPYAISKLTAEHYVRFFAERRRSVASYLNVRFFGAYGPYEPARKITTRWLHAMMRGQHEFPIRGDGENLIDFMYVDDAVDGFLRLTSAAGSSRTIDFSCGAPVTVNDVVAAMERVFGVDVRVVHEGHTEEYIKFRSVDETMRNQFAFAPALSFDDGLRRLHDFLVKEGHDAGQPA